MKALVLRDYNDLSYQEVPDPEISEDEVLVRVRACGICGSDVHGMDGSTGRRVPPLIMGHEAAGEIAGLGAKVTEWQLGDRVTFDSTVYPLDDWYTQNGQYNLSDSREVLGVSPGAYKRNGAFAEFLAVPQHVLHRVPDAVSFEDAAMVEPIAVALHAVKLAGINVGDRCSVVGVGTIGAFILMVLKLAGAGQVVAVDLSEAHRERALALGADFAYDPRENDLVEKARARSDGRGLDVVFEAVGIDATVGLAIELLRKGGTGVLVGNLSPQVSFPLQKVVTQQLRILGSCAICGEYPAALRLLEQGRISVREHIAAVAPLSEGAEWFAKLQRGEAQGKVILKP